MTMFRMRDGVRELSVEELHHVSGGEWENPRGDGAGTILGVGGIIVGSALAITPAGALAAVIVGGTVLVGSMFLSKVTQIK